MGPTMSCKAGFEFKNFISLVALEWSLNSVFHPVFSQITKLGASINALVTFEWLFSSVISYHVNFQVTMCNARIVACCASLWLFSGVRLLVPNQVACICCFVFALIAMVLFFPGVLLDMSFEVERISS